MTKTINFKPDKKVCSSSIDITIVDNVITNLQIKGGCPGNGLGLSKLIVGLTPKQVIEKFSGIKCHTKDTSCPDQIAKALITTIQEK